MAVFALGEVGMFSGPRAEPSGTDAAEAASEVLTPECAGDRGFNLSAEPQAGLERHWLYTVAKSPRDVKSVSMGKAQRGSATGYAAWAPIGHDLLRSRGKSGVEAEETASRERPSAEADQAVAETRAAAM